MAHFLDRYPVQNALALKPISTLVVKTDSVSLLNETGVSGTTFSFSNKATGGAYAIVDVVCNQAQILGITYGGVPMFQLSNLGGFYTTGTTFAGWASRYGLNGVLGGVQNIVVTLSATNTGVVAACATYTNVGSQSTAMTALAGSGADITVSSSAFTCPSQGMINCSFVSSTQQGFGFNGSTKPAGGALRVQTQNFNYPYYNNENINMLDSAASTTFSATLLENIGVYQTYSIITTTLGVAGGPSIGDSDFAPVGTFNQSSVRTQGVNTVSMARL